MKAKLYEAIEMNKLNEKECCENCRFAASSVNNSYTCRRFPPTVIYTPSPYRASSVIYENPNVWAFGWCGEFGKITQEGEVK